jgi:hypothetical protein
MYAGTWHYNKFQGCEPRNPTASPRYRRHRKSSVRRRPKSEWLPLVLPLALCIVPRERWKRVQRQLDQNIAFSPRNEKHSYLLKGLLWCGACGSRYGGDPCHGKFYYRCIARCKRMPAIRESALDEAVKGAVLNVLVNPGLILEPLRQLDEAEARDLSEHRDTALVIEQEVNRLDTEEQRILDAYRTGVISPAQLADQLEKLKSRRVALDLRRVEMERNAATPAPDAREAITDYCAEAVANLAEFTTDEWKQLLRTVIVGITFKGNNIAIRGRIPIVSDAVEKSAREFRLDPIPLSQGDAVAALA